MKTTFEEIWNLAKPHLTVKKGNIHTKIAMKYAFKLLKMEGGNENIVIPAIILHDIGWKNVPKKIMAKAFGPFRKEGLSKIHSMEGAKLAKKILTKINYDKKLMEQIIKIIEFHDSDKKATSLNEKIVRDADKLWRFSKEGFQIDCDRFNQTTSERIKAKDMKLNLLLTDSAKKIAKKEIQNRLKESNSD